MIEFIGSTGAGKTTLIAEVQRKLVGTLDVSTACNLIAVPLGAQSVSHPTAQNLIQELVGFPFFVFFLRRNKRFLIFALRMLARHSSFTLFTINYLRSLERTIGVYEILRRYARDRVVLVDEGTMLSAHNIFVYTDTPYSSEEIDEFASLVPLPDLIVYVKAPIDVLIKRSLQRSDPPREMRCKDPALIEKYIKRADAVFEQLAKAEKIRNRILIVENRESTGNERDAVVDYVSEFIRNYATGTQG
jgi:thymidylate kinase